MTAVASTDFEDPEPSPSPLRAVTDGCRQGGGEGAFSGFRKPLIDWELAPFLARHGLGPAEILATLVALTTARYDEHAKSYFVEWNQELVAQRSTTNASASTRARRKLQAAGLITMYRAPKKSVNAAIFDITALITAKGK